MLTAEEQRMSQGEAAAACLQPRIAAFLIITETQFHLPFTGSLSKFLQQLGLDQTKARNLELCKGRLAGWQEPG